MGKLNEVGRSLVAGAVIYAVMAACGNKNAPDQTAGGLDDAGSATGSDSSWLDALTDPVPAAEGSSRPNVATEPCNFTLPDGAPGFVWAVHAYPGKTVTELSAVRAVAHIPDAPASTSRSDLPGYNHHIAPVQLKDGSAAVYCGGNFDSVDFILPE